MTTQDLLDRSQSIIDEIRSDAITPARMGELLRDIIALSDKRDVDITSLFDGMIYNVSQITGNYGLNASTAREAVPINKRRLAQMVVYRTAQGTVAEMYNSSNIDGWKDQWNWITLAPVSRVSYLEAKLPIDRTNKIPGSNGETREVQTLRYVDPVDVIHEIGIDQEGVPFVHSSGVYNRLVKDVELQATNESIENLRIDIFENTISKEYLTDGSENVVLIVNDDADRTAGIGVNSLSGKASVFKGTGLGREKKDLATEEYVDAREVDINKEIGYVRTQLLDTVPKSNNADGSSDRYIYNEDDGGSVSVLGVESKTGKVFSGRGWNPTSKPKKYLATEEYVGAEVKKVADKNAQLEQNVNLFNRRPQGLKFKAGDNSVFAKTMKALVLGTDDFTVCVVARTEGSIGTLSPILGFSKSSNSASSMSVLGYTANGTNGVHAVFFQSPISGGTGNNVFVQKNDNTTNLHHIVITRSGTLVTCTINGRLVKSVTQDRILDFSNFTFDIANTTYFWGGAVVKGALSQSLSNRYLWNGGRYDDIKLDDIFRRVASISSISDYRNDNNDVQRQDAGYGYIRVSGYQGSTRGVVYVFNTKNIKHLKVDINNNTDTELRLDTFAVSINAIVVPSKGTVSVYLDKLDVNFFHFYPRAGHDFNIKVTANCYQCLLEYRPENIREDRYLNSGTMGSEFDLVYSAVKPEIIYDKPYADKVMLDENKAPDWQPIAMGQEVETPTNIFKAKLPDVGKEWQVSDWKQINN